MMLPSRQRLADLLLIPVRRSPAQADDFPGLCIHDDTNLVAEQIFGLEHIISPAPPQARDVAKASRLDVANDPPLSGFLLRRYAVAGRPHRDERGKGKKQKCYGTKRETHETFIAHST